LGKRRKKKNKSRFPIKALSKKIDQRIVLRGFKALDSVFRRGLAPQELYPHFLLCWFSWGNGNALQVAQISGMHRNTVQNDFEHIFGSRETLSFRRRWREILKANPKSTFLEKMVIFYKRLKVKPTLKPAEIKALADVWIQGAPHQVPRSYFILWALRRNWTLKRILKKLNRVYRDFCRYRLQAVIPGTPIYKWISRIPNDKKEWFFMKKGLAWKNEKT
jgi:hypothetical protein